MLRHCPARNQRFESGVLPRIDLGRLSGVQRTKRCDVAPVLMLVNSGTAGSIPELFEDEDSDWVFG
jgi:hypothetical protein